MLSGLPPVDAEDLFRRYFLPLYPADARRDLARSRSLDANPGGNRSILMHLDDAAQRFALNATALFETDLRLDRSDASVHRLGAALTLRRRDAWAARGLAGTTDNALFNAVVHGAAYVGACIVANHRAAWAVRRPLWESVVRVRSAAGETDLAVFHWWLKSLSTSVLDVPSGAGLGDRYRAHVEVPTLRPETLPVIVAGDRRLPRLNNPSYARLHKYLCAHLPEVRSLGDDFPSAERFATFALAWMDFHVVGGGRSVLLAGASAEGLHLFWLGVDGFEKSAFVPGDGAAEPSVRIHDDRITATTSDGGQPRVREMFWWGP
ncbi:MAG TPA: hypothetical protein VEK07_13700 [Polyangiaceae bacterium]|nr:hypothetical protein [Polyangiaceae bacterium]